MNAQFTLVTGVILKGTLDFENEYGDENFGTNMPLKDLPLKESHFEFWSDEGTVFGPRKKTEAEALASFIEMGGKILREN